MKWVELRLWNRYEPGLYLLKDNLVAGGVTKTLTGSSFRAFVGTPESTSEKPLGEFPTLADAKKAVEEAVQTPV